MENQDLAVLLKEMENRINEATRKVVSESEDKLRSEIAETRREIMAFIEIGVDPKIQTIAEGVATLVNREPTPDKVTAHIEDMNIRVPALEQAAKAQRADIDKIKEELQKAQ